MPCDCCETARHSPTYSVHCPSCLPCGARLIQNLMRLPIARSEASARARAMLKVWTDYGHPEIEIRRLVKLKTPPLAESSTAPPKRVK
jgi:hypothetical protein